MLGDILAHDVGAIVMPMLEVNVMVIEIVMLEMLMSGGCRYLHCLLHRGCSLSCNASRFSRFAVGPFSDG
jgi:hypothetical protein